MAPIIVAGAVAIIGWFVTGYFAYRLGLRSKKLERQWAVEDAKKARRAEFIDFANLIKTTINTSHTPMDWVNFFKDNAVTFLTCYEKFGLELSASEKIDVRDAMTIIAKFAGMSHGEIYEKEQEFYDALDKIPQT